MTAWNRQPPQGVTSKMNSMIDVKELRYGNLIQNVQKRLCEVYGIFPNDREVFVKTISDEGKPRTISYYSEEVVPIPLTEEWLIRLGFIEQEYDYEKIYSLNGVDVYTVQFHISKDYKGLFHVSTIEESSMDGSGYSNTLGIPLMYVHSLQNCWYFLTGEELQIKNL